MNILGLCEGARADSGGVGIVAVPGIHVALSGRGHHVGLAIAGQPMHSAGAIQLDRLQDVFASPGRSAVGVVGFSAFGRWGFAPRLHAAANEVAHRVDFVTLHSLFSYPVLTGYMVARRHRKPYGLWPHGVLAPFQRSVSRGKKALYNFVAARRIVNSASVIFFTAEGERQEARAFGFTSPSVVIPHGIDVGEFSDLPPAGEFRRKYLNGSDDPIVLFLARLNAKKGIDLLVHAMARVVRAIPRAKLVFAGSGDPPAFVGEVRKWVRAAGIANSTVFTGLVEGQDKRAAFGDCDVFVMPSIAENFGCSLFEAMASRRAVICADTINYADEVRQYDAGIVVPRDAEAFAEAIKTLLRDPGRRARLGENGRSLAEQYSWQSCGRRVELTMQSVIARAELPSELHPEPGLA